MNYLTTYGKAFVFTLAILMLGILISIVWNGRLSNDCEALHNQFTSASDMGERANLFEKGVDNGCFHAN